MVSALLCSGELNLAAWEPYVSSRATKAQSVERRWQQFMENRDCKLNCVKGQKLRSNELLTWRHQFYDFST